MRKVIVFFNGDAPYLIQVGVHLPSLRLEYPDGKRTDLPIRKALINGERGEYAYASDREVEFDEIRDAFEKLDK
ncbi:TPA: hypothetical protein ACHQNL_001392 [Serratia marcescens]|uniref:hypothetical protein n=1 Tax=Serratia marcescens TaxID=615 RepID=UPI00112B226A|nr:hypothetical protein [Serratia marcescens]MBH2762338.1 hypothetical protein [Serratia marcescens]MBN5432064.1 hypothetical protein [Serratia marcescens]MDS0779159.1 hypothetical protein [Serratia marcescens]TPV63799.1 hypothetical protein FJ699_21695 [Serratia marcescens]BEO08455.1 hypothetical protein SMQC15_13670 [Serratia marcescens]